MPVEKSPYRNNRTITPEELEETTCIKCRCKFMGPDKKRHRYCPTCLKPGPKRLARSIRNRSAT